MRTEFSIPWVRPCMENGNGWLSPAKAGSDFPDRAFSGPGSQYVIFRLAIVEMALPRRTRERELLGVPYSSGVTQSKLSRDVERRELSSVIVSNVLTEEENQQLIAPVG